MPIRSVCGSNPLLRLYLIRGIGLALLLDGWRLWGNGSLLEGCRSPRAHPTDCRSVSSVGLESFGSVRRAAVRSEHVLIFSMKLFWLQDLARGGADWDVPFPAGIEAMRSGRRARVPGLRLLLLPLAG
ncbi:hypothetical protein EJB05_30964, partial [Eragrostis curvula]